MAAIPREDSVILDLIPDLISDCVLWSTLRPPPPSSGYSRGMHDDIYIKPLHWDAVHLLYPHRGIAGSNGFSGEVAALSIPVHDGNRQQSQPFLRETRTIRDIHAARSAQRRWLPAKTRPTSSPLLPLAPTSKTTSNKTPRPLTNTCSPLLQSKHFPPRTPPNHPSCRTENWTSSPSTPSGCSPYVLPLTATENLLVTAPDLSNQQLSDLRLCRSMLHRRRTPGTLVPLWAWLPSPTFSSASA